MADLIRVIVADYRPAFRAGIARFLIETDPHIEP